MLAESDFDEALRIEHRPAYQIAFGLIEGLSRICEIELDKGHNSISVCF
jgi:hypothetical protein